MKPWWKKKMMGTCFQATGATTATNSSLSPCGGLLWSQARTLFGNCMVHAHHLYFPWHGLFLNLDMQRWSKESGTTGKQRLWLPAQLPKSALGCCCKGEGQNSMWSKAHKDLMLARSTVWVREHSNIWGRWKQFWRRGEDTYLTNCPKSSQRVSQPGHLHSPCPYRGWEPGVSSWEELQRGSIKTQLLKGRSRHLW